MKYLINERYDVSEANQSRDFAKGEKRGDYADAWQDTGNVILIGLSGAGKRELAGRLADRTGLVVFDPDSPGDAVQALSGNGHIVVLDEALVEDAGVQPRIHGAGKVFYLMADSQTLSERVADRDGIEDREKLWREMSARLAVMEPVFYTVLHFILQPADMGAMADDALEKIAF